jgi:uncharacterized protein (TIGR00251 family)
MMVVTRDFKFHSGRFGSAIAVRVTPRASKNEVCEVMKDGTIKIKLMSPPVEGKANQALIDYLSEILKIPPSKFEIVLGSTNRNKLIAIEGIDAETLQKRISEIMR